MVLSPGNWTATGEPGGRAHGVREGTAGAGEGDAESETERETEAEGGGEAKGKIDGKGERVRRRARERRRARLTEKGREGEVLLPCPMSRFDQSVKHFLSLGVL